MGLSVAQRAAVRDIEAICTQEADSRVLRQRVAARLSRLVQWDAACFATIDPWTMLITDDYAINIPPELQAQAAHNEYLIDDVHKLSELARTGRTVAVLSQAPQELREASHRLGTVLPAIGARHEVRAVCLVDGQCWGGFALFRGGNAPDFSRAEADLLRTVAAPLAAGLRRTAHSAWAAAGGSPGPGVLFLGSGDETLAASDTVWQWLDELAPVPARPGGQLPFVIHQVAARVQAAHVRPRHSAGRPPGAYARVRARSGRWVAIHGSAADSSLSPGKGTAIVIEPAPGSAIAEMLMGAYGLTGREREVLQRVIAGAPSSAIAAQLHVSVNTVHGHMKMLFAKVGVRSRGQLVARVLGEHYSPEAS